MSTDCNLKDLQIQLNDKIKQIKTLKINIEHAQTNILGELNSSNLKKCKFSNSILLNELITLEEQLEKHIIKQQLIQDANTKTIQSTITDISRKKDLHNVEIQLIKDMYEKDILETTNSINKYDTYIKNIENITKEYNTNYKAINDNNVVLIETIKKLKLKLKILKTEKDTVLSEYDIKYKSIEKTLKKNIIKQSKKYCCSKKIDLDQFNKLPITENIPIDISIFNEINKLVGGNNKCKNEKDKLEYKLNSIKIYFEKLTNLLNKCYMYEDKKGVTIDEICYTNTQVKNKIIELKKQLKFSQDNDIQTKVDTLKDNQEVLSEYSEELNKWEEEKIKLKTNYILELNKSKNKLDKYINIYGSENELKTKLEKVVNTKTKNINKLEEKQLKLTELKLRLENIINIQINNNVIIQTSSLQLINKQIEKNTQILKQMKECTQCL